MRADLRKDEVGELACDVAVVGAGVAGQTLAISLAGRGHDVLLIEAGGRDFDAVAQQGAAGRNVGEDYYDLETTRLRLFGGTAAIWGGRCAELDPIDFERRSWVAHSGWPITKADLDPYYRDSFADLGLLRPGGTDMWEATDTPRPGFDADKLDADMWVFDEEGERFTDVDRGHLCRTRQLLNAAVTEVEVGPQGHVRSLTCTSTNGRTAKVVARSYVLANGAIDTVRLLTGGVPARPDGLGNEHDILGRYFMEHPHARGGQILPEKLAKVITLLPRAIRHEGRRYAAYLRPAEALQREAGILNTSLSIAPRRHEGEKVETFRAVTNKLKHDLPSSRLWRSSYHRLKSLAVRGLEWTDPWSSVLNMKLSGKLGLYAIIRAEQAPNPDSRVTLGSERDPFGMREPVLDWRFLPIDRRSVRILMETLDGELRRMGLGHAVPAPWLSESGPLWATDPLISAHPIGGYHHMGGARMGSDPKTSVVDADCRLHASPNLYLAGSAVFPTGGWANPTVTIMALAKRLADHIHVKSETGNTVGVAA